MENPIKSTPVDQRNRRFDEQRVQELQMLQIDPELYKTPNNKT